MKRRKRKRHTTDRKQEAATADTCSHVEVEPGEEEEGERNGKKKFMRKRKRKRNRKRERNGKRKRNMIRKRYRERKGERKRKGEGEEEG